MRWRHTWPGGDRPLDEMLVLDDGRTVARVDHVTDGPEDKRWRWFWQPADGDAVESGAGATQEAAKGECENRARKLKKAA